MRAQPLLALRRLTVELPPGADRPYALQDVDLDLHAGEVLCVVGESGSGKSLAANAILGLLPPGVRASAGQILWQGQDLLALPHEALRRLRGNRIGMIFQEPMTALNPLHTVGRQIEEVFKAHTSLPAAERRQRTLELLEAVRIPQSAAAVHAYPHQLSGGQRQRAMIAMALALDPALLIADEPTTALDVTTQAQILGLIRDLQRRHGTAVLFITHDFGVVADIADRVAVMQRGRVVESGPAAQILEAPGHPYTRALIAAIPSLTPPPRSVAPLGEPALVAERLSKTYRRRSGWLVGTRARTTQAVREVSLCLPTGRTLGIVGESGCGKSTLARILLGLIDPDGGTLDWAGQPLPAGGRARRLERARRVQMVFQDPYDSLNPRRRVGDIVTQGPIARGVPRAEAMARACELFSLVGLGPDALGRYPHEFSGGQRQRIGLARALALEPAILVADEPVSGLDVSVQAQVLALLADLQDRLGLSMIFITHDLRVAAQVCDRVAIMHGGEIVEEGSCADIFGRAVHPYTRALLAAVPGRHWQVGGGREVAAAMAGSG